MGACRSPQAALACDGVAGLAASAGGDVASKSAGDPEERHCAPEPEPSTTEATLALSGETSQESTCVIRILDQLPDETLKLIGAIVRSREEDGLAFALTCRKFLAAISLDDHSSSAGDGPRGCWVSHAGYPPRRSPSSWKTKAFLADSSPERLDWILNLRLVKGTEQNGQGLNPLQQLRVNSTYWQALISDDWSYLCSASLGELLVIRAQWRQPLYKGCMSFEETRRFYLQLTCAACHNQHHGAAILAWMADNMTELLRDTGARECHPFAWAVESSSVDVVDRLEIGLQLWMWAVEQRAHENSEFAVLEWLQLWIHNLGYLNLQDEETYTEAFSEVDDICKHAAQHVCLGNLQWLVRSDYAWKPQECFEQAGLPPEDGVLFFEWSGRHDIADSVTQGEQDVEDVTPELAQEILELKAWIQGHL
eukprot:COSAG02_NODE_9199_length_2291_cov_2.859489_1_plen_423_part_00